MGREELLMEKFTFTFSGKNAEKLAELYAAYYMEV